MPYNSSSFERQLAKYKQAQAEKAVADMPRKKYATYDDPHQIKSKVSADRGSIKSYALDPVQIMGEGAQTAPIARDPVSPLSVKKAKKPFYKRAWFIFLIITTLPTLAAPVLFKDEWRELVGMAESIKASTGVDPFAISTYKNLFNGRSAPAANPMASLSGEATPEATSGVQIEQGDMAAPMDMNNAVEAAQERAESITSKGADYSMKYIEEETRRLNEAAKQFDDQYKK